MSLEGAHEKPGKRTPASAMQFIRSFIHSFICSFMHLTSPKETWFIRYQVEDCWVVIYNHNHVACICMVKVRQESVLALWAVDRLVGVPMSVD